jgi:hypothetical protein
LATTSGIYKVVCSEFKLRGGCDFPSRKIINQTSDNEISLTFAPQHTIMYHNGVSYSSRGGKVRSPAQVSYPQNLSIFSKQLCIKKEALVGWQYWWCGVGLLLIFLIVGQVYGS